MQLKNRALTLVQALGVILALFVIAAAGYGLYSAVARILHQRLVKASIPQCLDILRRDRETLRKAIEKYHTQLGYYPPDHSTNKNERAHINSLYYELVGTRWIPQNKAFGIPTAKEVIKPKEMIRFFGMSAFSNSLVYPDWPTNFLAGSEMVGREEDDIAMVSYMLPEQFDDQLDDFVITPWRYLADPAEHNKGKFDIWIEVTAQGQHFVIGNWPDVR